MVSKTAKARPTDSNLYNKTKKYFYKKYPKHSAYRSGLLVQKYKSNFTKKYGNKKQPYIGTKTRKKGLRRWFDEEWVNQRGEVGYKFKNDIYRPKNRITKDTPIIHDELTDKEIKKARSKKYRKGRVNRFRKEKMKGGFIEEDEVNDFTNNLKYAVNDCFDTLIDNISNLNDENSYNNIVHMQYLNNMEIIPNLSEDQRNTIIDNMKKFIIYKKDHFVHNEYITVGVLHLIGNKILEKVEEKINPTFHGGKWSDKYKKSINCKNPKGFSQKQHCKYGKKGGKKTRKNIKPMKKERKYYFKDYPDFTPNLSPREMFLLGSFGGTYWRPIYSGVLKKNLKNIHKKYPEEWWKNIPENELSSKNYDISKNKYKVRVGTTLEFWESKGWIDPAHPYGWVHWYCDFFMGKRSKDDERQISRWKKLAGYKGRFMRFLVTQIINKNATWDDETISPKIRQVLQHWGYKLTKEDYSYEIRRRKK